ncbi:MAG: aspartate--tRNA ligase, partial [Angelakisella sp.]
MADTMTGLKRTNYCGEVTAALEGKEVVVCGWVQRIRDKGMLVFIDLRDRSGIVQLAFDDTTEEALRQKAQSARSEFVLMAKGVVRRRESINKDMPNGDVEVAVSDLRILAKAATPPFEITEKTNVKEELRLKYRYLDLRRKEMQENIMMRHRIVKEARDYYDHTGFIEIETPTLIKSTPEGARDYLVPSRVQPGHFYALPQSPQQYKQLLMLSGYDRYMQVARCYRDEDLRADRQPEFTQIDVEMSFVDEQDVMGVAEGFLQQAFKNVLNIDLTTPFPILKYKDAMEQYGSDKPDIRFDLKIHNLTDVLKNTEFKMFAEAIAAGGSVRGIVAKDAADKLTRKEIDKLGDFVKTYRAKGLAYTRFTAEGVTSSFEKFLSPEEIAAMHTALGASTGDVLFVIADVKDKVVFDSLGALRNHLAQKLELTQPGTFAPLWVTEFPLFEYDEE